MTVPYDIARARLVMNECERHVSFARANPSDERTDEDWEEKLNRYGGSAIQSISIIKNLFVYGCSSFLLQVTVTLIKKQTQLLGSNRFVTSSNGVLG